MGKGKNLGVFGVPEHSLFDVSSALKGFQVSHRILENSADSVEYVLREDQPAMVYLVRNLANVARIEYNETGPFVVFVDASAHELALSNCRILLGNNLPKMLRDALKDSHRRQEEFTLQITTKSLDDYVNEATKPTFLYFIQTAIYKLTPYALVKESRTAIISALYGATPMKALYTFLDTSLKLEDLKNLLKNERAKQVRELVIEVRRQMKQFGDSRREGDIVDSVIAGTGIDPFDILYVIKSFEKMERDKASGKRRGRPPKDKSKVRR